MVHFANAVELVQIQVVRPPDSFFVDGNSYTIPIILTNNSNETRNFDVSVISYPYEIRDSSAYLQPVTYPSQGPVEPGASYALDHEFTATWAGRWSFNVTAIGNDITGNTNAVQGFGRGDIQVHPLSDQLAIDANELTQAIAGGSIFAAVAGIATAIVIWKTQSATIATMRQQLYNDMFERWEDKTLEHSKNIVDTLQAWIEGTFVPYAVDSPERLFKVNSFNEPEIPLLKEAKEHLQKSNPEILTSYGNMKSEAERISKEVCDLMVSAPSSFTNLIVNKIAQEVPELKRISELQIIDDTYIDFRIFKVVLDADEEERQGKSPSPLNIEGAARELQLRYHGNPIAVGERKYLCDLQVLLMEFRTDEVVKNVIQRFNALRNELQENYNTSDLIKKKIDLIRGLVYKGVSLQEESVCEKCRPKPAPYVSRSKLQLFLTSIRKSKKE